MKDMTPEIRLYYDVLFSGPTYIWYASYINHLLIKNLLIIFGILTIIMNYSYYLFGKGKKNIFHNIFSIKILGKFDNNELDSKTQFNRLLLLLVGYPLVLYSLHYYSKKVPIFLKFLTLFKVLFGSAYNLYYFMKYIIV